MLNERYFNSPTTRLQHRNVVGVDYYRPFSSCEIMETMVEPVNFMRYAARPRKELVIDIQTNPNQ